MQNESDVVSPDTDDEVVDPGFTIVDAGTIGVRFHIYDNTVREVLQGPDILGPNASIDDTETEGKKAKFNRLAVYGLLDTMVKNVGLKQFRKVVKENIERADCEPIYKAMDEQLKIVATLVSKNFLETGKIAWAEFPLALADGEVIAISHEGNIHAGEIISIETKFSYYIGFYQSVRLRILIASVKGFKYGEISHVIPQYSDDRTVGELGIQFITDELRSMLIARGAKYVQLTTAPAYVTFTGALVRRGYYGPRRHRATGRVIIDVRSMSTMDPDYDYYYGVDRYGDDDGDSGGPIDLKNEKLLLIASPYVYGFSMLAKKWGEMTVDSISDIVFRTDAFDRLVLDNRVKRMLNAQVSGNLVGDSGDIIDGKGGGLTYLLHGGPGIGKTLTAEAIAEKLNRPLYSVSTGELGTNPDTLDTRLKNILDMASAWNAILLIDEADIFLERRSSGDVERNAMVGIFLKLLEYYEGILFLTTNRVKEIDEAFYSRISLAIRYPELDEAKRLIVWRNLLEFAGPRADDVNVAELAKKAINGRQIKHIVRQAGTLAKFEDHILCQQDIIDVMDLAMEFGIKRDADAPSFD